MLSARAGLSKPSGNRQAESERLDKKISDGADGKETFAIGLLVMLISAGILR